MPRLTQSRAERTTLPQTGQRFIRCSEIVGLAVRVLPTGARAWVVHVRYRGKEKRITLGSITTLQLDGPNGAAELAKVALNAARGGQDPLAALGRTRRPDGATLAEIWQSYGDARHPLLNAVGRFKRASSVKADSYRWQKHFKRIADEPAAAFDNARVQKWLDTVPGPGARSHCLIMLKGLLSFAASRGLCEPHKITLTARPSRKVQNFLSVSELKTLDATLVAMIAEQPGRIFPLSAIRLLLHTGCRKSEVLTLEWTNVDLDHAVIHLPVDKASGENVGRDVLLSVAAVEVLRGLPRLARGGWCFPARTRRGHLIDLEHHWPIALERAGLKRIRLHDLRHSHAATLIGRGVSLFTAGALLGHRDARTTQRYAHLERAAQREAIEKAAAALAS